MTGESQFKCEFLSAIMGQGSSANCFEENIVCSLEGHEGAVLNVEVGPDGKTLATCSADGTVKLWNIITGELLQTLKGHEKPVTNCAFIHSADKPDKILATTSDDGVVFLWHYDKGRRAARLAVHSKAVLDCVFAKDGRALATCSEDMTIRHFRIKPGPGEFVPGLETRCLRGHRGAVNVVAFSNDKQFIFSGSDDKTIRIWSRETRKCEKVYKCDCVGGGVTSLRFSASGDSLVVLAREPRCVEERSQERSQVRSQDNHQPVAHYLSVWSLDCADGKEWSIRNVLSSEETRDIATISFIPDGMFLVGCSCDNRVMIWDSSDLRVHGSYQTRKAFRDSKPTPHCQGILSCCFDPYGKRFITGDGTGIVHIWM